MGKKLNIAFLWHMHQPVYKDPASAEYIMPWVLLHGTKDYLDMVSVLDDFPLVRQTFNLVPSLIEQLSDYASGNASDKYRNISLKDAEDLSEADKVFILEWFFQANWDNMVKPIPRYWELLRKRGFSSRKEDVRDSARYFTVDDFRDLQLLFNFVWIDPSIRNRDSVLKGLAEKGKNFTEADKKYVLDKQIEIIAAIIPKYKEMRDKGMIEITVSPYYHPILPLLCDSASAKVAMPEMMLPNERFRNPDDASAQLKKAVEFYEVTFGGRPSGMWPSEGSVSPEAVSLIRREGLEWIATDEDILALSTGLSVARDKEGHPTSSVLYKPYSVETPDGPITMVFRDRSLSDLIGFEYSRWDAEAAAGDFIERLAKIRELTGDPEEHVVMVILDGENAWESYKNDGGDFLRALYSRLSESDVLRCVTVGEFLSSCKSREPIKRLFSGSWINHNFKIWIGHQEDNAAWDLISGARKALVEYASKASSDAVASERASRAWNELYIAEGSDWFWWYGDDNASLNDREFDWLMRAHLKRVYEIIGSEPPQTLDIPIIAEERSYLPPVIPMGFINPVIDGEVTNYFEWLSAGRMEPVTVGGAMHKGAAGAEGFLRDVVYGFNLETLFLRLDYVKAMMPYEKEWRFTINFIHPYPMKADVIVKGEIAKGVFSSKVQGGNGWTESGAMDNNIAAKSCVEAAIDFKRLGAKPGDEVRLFIDVETPGARERWPVRGFLSVEVPTEDFEAQHWMV
ncbi:MAG: glycoside hydrolase family 57 protein [Thermodesulfobacteriota bacterium]